jgi:hypothetical protein
MCHDLDWKMTKTVLLISFVLTLLSRSAAAVPVEFVYPRDLSWKAVFDNGLRPKHIPGLERKKVECVDQEINFRYKDESLFSLDRGRLMMELQSDDSIRVIEHMSRVPVTREEGTKRMVRFHELFGNKLLRKGTVPPLMDKEHGSVRALSDYYAAAEDEGYTIHFGFTSSFQKDKPLIPVFMIALRHDMKAVPPPIRRTAVEPPEGYEWYSLDPGVSPPSPGSPIDEDPEPEAQSRSAVVSPPFDEGDQAGEVEMSAERSDELPPDRRLLFWVGLAAVGILVLCAVVLRIKRR